MAAAVALATCSVALLFLAPALLAGATWQQRAPRAAIILWQSIGIAACIAAVGAGIAVSVSPIHTSVFGGLVDFGGRVVHGGFFQQLGVVGAIGLTFAVDIAFAFGACLTVTALRSLRGRAHHRGILDVIASDDARLDGVVVLESAQVIAYCLPGLRPRIVVSRGALAALSSEEMHAVLDHERGHASAHHELMMLPFSSVQGLFAWIPFARLGPACVAGLAEMAADDFACRRSDPFVVANALLRLVEAGAARPPACAFASTSTLTGRRILRLQDPARVSARVGAVAVVLTLAVLAFPLVAMAVHWPGH